MALQVDVTMSHFLRRPLISPPTYNIRFEVSRASAFTDSQVSTRNPLPRAFHVEDLVSHLAMPLLPAMSGTKLPPTYNDPDSASKARARTNGPGAPPPTACRVDEAVSHLAKLTVPAIEGKLPPTYRFPLDASNARENTVPYDPVDHGGVPMHKIFTNTFTCIQKPNTAPARLTKSQTPKRRLQSPQTLSEGNNSKTDVVDAQG